MDLHTRGCLHLNFAVDYCDAYVCDEILVDSKHPAYIYNLVNFNMN